MGLIGTLTIIPGSVDAVYRHTKSKRERGLCAFGGCRVETGDDYRCPSHKAAHNKAEKKRKDAARAARPATS